MPDFRFLRWRLSAILDFLKVVNFNSRSGSEAQFASPCQILRKSVKPFRRYCRFRDFSRWRPSAILDLFYACWYHPRRVFGGICDCAKFGCNRRSNFESRPMQIFNFLHVKLENAYSRPQNRGFRGLYPQNGEQYERDPKRHIRGRKHVE